MRQECEPGMTQVLNHSLAECVPCPVPNEYCHPNGFKMRVGQMVQEKNISMTLFCPNSKACPGGKSTNFAEMCAEGYEDISCSSCAEGYGIADLSVLVCTRCATMLWQRVRQWIYMLLMHVLPFAMAANSALQVQGVEASWTCSRMKEA